MKNFKKVIVFILSNVFILGNLTVNTFAMQNPSNQGKSKKLIVNARSAIAIDAKTKRVLYEKDGYTPVAMASTTKMMTSLVTISRGDLDKKVTISKKAASVRGSHAGYKAGEEIKIEELLYGLMLRSGNDAAIAIAEGIAGSVDKFCDLMNEYAYSIGALDTHFESPHGLDSQRHYSTPYDLALIAAKAKETKEFNDIVSCKEITQKEKNFTRGYNNINKILWQIPEANGIKTGYTGNAGKCLVTSVNIEGNDVIIVVLNCPGRWNETKKIYNYVKENYKFEKVANKDDVVQKSNIEGRNVNLITDNDVTVPVKKDEQLKKEVLVNQNLNKTGKNNIAGELVLKNEKGETLYKQALKAK